MEYLREYLVGLGFKLDEGGWSKFKGRVSETHKGVVELGSAAAATAVAIGVMVEKVARHYEDLYYASQRTRMSASYLEQFAAGAKLIGLSYDQARSAAEGFGAAVRTNPGAKALADQLGVKNPMELVEKLKARFGERGYPVAAIIAQQVFNMDEPTLFHMWHNFNKLNAEMKKFKELQSAAGIDADANAERFLKFSNMVDRLGQSFSNMGTRMAMAWVDPAEFVAEKLKALIDKLNEADAKSGGTIARVDTVAFGGLGALLATSLLGLAIRRPGVAMGAARLAGPVGLAAGLGAWLLPKLWEDKVEGDRPFDIPFQIKKALGWPTGASPANPGGVAPIPPPGDGAGSSMYGGIPFWAKNERPVSWDVTPIGGSGGPPVNINQTTTITVQGAGDPQETTDRVTKAQDRVNSDMRNQIGKMR